jgi:hypothetical protein
MLLGINSHQELEQHNNRGAIFEGFILAEILKRYCSRGKQARCISGVIMQKWKWVD